MKQDENAKVGCLLLIATIPLGMLSTLWFGYVISILWQWFATRFYPRQITVPEAMGLALMVQLFRPVFVAAQKEKTGSEVFLEAVFFCAYAPAIALLFGFIIKHF